MLAGFLGDDPPGRLRVFWNFPHGWEGLPEGRAPAAGHPSFSLGGEPQNRSWRKRGKRMFFNRLALSAAHPSGDSHNLGEFGIEGCLPVWPPAFGHERSQNSISCSLQWMRTPELVEARFIHVIHTCAQDGRSMNRNIISAIGYRL